jgi:tetratricopeptide (TPR) repeat protein
MHRRGAVSVGWIVLIALLAVAVSAVVYLAMNPSNEGTADPAPLTQDQIDEKLGALQQDFQTALQEQQDLNRIAGQARAFTEDHPESQGGFVLLAQARMALKQWPQAYTAWQATLSFDQNAFEFNKMAGLCAAKLGKLKQALAHYQQAASNGQADSEVYAALGRLHLALEDIDSAERMFQQAKDARGPGEETNYRHEAYAGLADVSVVKGDFSAALELVDRAIKMAKLDSDGDIAAYHIQKARIYMDADRDEDAVTMLSYTWSEFADAPWRIESARLRAKLYQRADQLENAVNYLQTITEWHRVAEARDNETLANFTALLADWQIKAARIDDARISLHNLKTLAPEHPAIGELTARLR